MAKEIDFPPVWLAGCAALGGVIGRVFPLRLVANAEIGGALILFGLGVMVLAGLQMFAARTTLMPRRDPRALVTGGIYRFSRNPIYLGDALVLAGLLIHWDALVALPLVAVFVAVITRRFIHEEEARLARHYGAAFDRYRAGTRRWI